jgi:hypothetical protein
VDKDSEDPKSAPVPTDGGKVKKDEPGTQVLKEDLTPTEIKQEKEAIIKEVKEAAAAADDHEKNGEFKKAGPKREKKPNQGFGKVQSFTNFEPIVIPNDLKANEDNAIRVGVMASDETIKSKIKVWEEILAHVRAKKPVFFLSPVGGLPKAFFQYSPGATRSVVFRGAEHFDMKKLPSGQFHFGLITGKNALDDLRRAGFMFVACSGSLRYYAQNLKQNKTAVAQASRDHQRLAALKSMGVVRGFIDKPSPLLDELIGSVDATDEMSTMEQ